MTFTLKIEILNWILFHTDSCKQKSNWKQDIHFQHESYFQQNSCLGPDSRWKLERYCTQESYSTKLERYCINERQLLSTEHRTKAHVLVKIDVLNWIMNRKQDID